MPFHPASSLARLIETPIRPGVVVWIGARPARREAMRAEPVALLAAGLGLVGDRYANAGGARQLTLIEAESLAAIASHLGRERVDGAEVRRNVVVRGINLLALKGRLSHRRGAARSVGRVPPVLAHGGDPRYRRLQRDARPGRHHRARDRGRADPDRRRGRRAGGGAAGATLIVARPARPDRAQPGATW